MAGLRSGERLSQTDRVARGTRPLRAPAKPLGLRQSTMAAQVNPCTERAIAQPTLCVSACLCLVAWCFLILCSPGGAGQCRSRDSSLGSSARPCMGRMVSGVLNVIYNDLKRPEVPLWNSIFIGFPMCSAPLFPWEVREKYYVTDFTYVLGYDAYS